MDSGAIIVPTPEDTRADIGSHGFWRWDTTTLFDILIFNLDVGSYLCGRPEKYLVKEEEDKNKNTSSSVYIIGSISLH